MFESVESELQDGDVVVRRILQFQYIFKFAINKGKDMQTLTKKEVMERYSFVDVVHSQGQEYPIIGLVVRSSTNHSQSLPVEAQGHQPSQFDVVDQFADGLG